MLDDQINNLKKSDEERRERKSVPRVTAFDNIQKLYYRMSELDKILNSI